MGKDDPRRDDTDNWSTRKLSKKTLAKNQVAAALGSNPVAQSLLNSPAAQTAGATLLVGAAPKVVRAIPKIVKAVAARAATTGLTLSQAAALPAAVQGGVVAVLAAAGLGSYFTTKWILERTSRRNEALALASDNYRLAKQNAAIAAGLSKDDAYKLPPAVLKALSDQYKQVTAEIRQRTFI